ncbi:MAG: hypothetical protein HYV60_14295 [Planctomycetia bacterium]|nr:hypothetical protein [Planctomycetia bacterium]
MAVTTVRVQYGSSGKPASGYRVSLTFTGGLGGVTESVNTDSHGIARIQHASVGEAKIIVQGTTRGIAHCPGEHTVTF